MDEPRAEDDGPRPRACSYAELACAEELAERLTVSGRSVSWRSEWVRSEPELTFAVAALLGTLLGLLALGSAIAAGIGLAVLLALWSLEIGGLPSPLARLRPERATQDVIAPDPKARTGVRSVLLLVRADLPRRPIRAAARICNRGGELAWLVIAATLALVALRALEWDGPILDPLQMIPAIGSLVLLAAALSARSAPIVPSRPDWTGIEQALEAAAMLDRDESDPRRCDIVVAGATGIGGAARVLTADESAGAACRCWEYRTGEAIVAAVRRLDDQRN